METGVDVPGYLLLHGSRYYPRGWNDFRGELASIAAAKAVAEAMGPSLGAHSQFAEIIDRRTWKVVLRGDGSEVGRGSRRSVRWTWGPPDED